MNAAGRLAIVLLLLLLPLAGATLAAEPRSAVPDLRTSRHPPAAGPRLMIVPEPAFASPQAALAARPVLAFEDGEGPVVLPRGALRVQLSGDASLTLRPRRDGLAIAWRKRF
ncbi:hypothetical protein [Rubrivivax benzoatilyticus]|uniref:hypothetical protein n=1 Tax=Rubrivivax benzoatilyticus TaxID=316997 RepID=UPI00020A3FAB|nr:hypothetical protein [Rubrivivax benzoatilyticus]EGJ12511.1 hypothetical protein RBXJA2T_19366 [Rubrivivax benzoatilyticus JA2 = ATCC BAA-35]